VHAAERSRSGDSYVYDLDIRDAAGSLVERWTGLCLRAVRRNDGRGPWLPALLGAYLERHAEPALGARVRCVVLPDEADEGGAPRGTQARRARTAAAVAWAADRQVTVRYRPDGRPEADGGPRMSASHGAGVTLALLGEPAVACDVEPVRPHTAREWRGLLGADGAALAGSLAAARTEDPQTAATRVWSAAECVRKLGRSRVDLTLDAFPGAAEDAGWAVFRSGDARIATFATALSGTGGPVVFALTTQGAP
jgi:enediyne polyketide synthase